MACARPVLAVSDRNSDLARLVSESSCGINVLPGSAEILAETIKRAFQKRQDWQRMGLVGREYVVRHYSREIVTDQYLELIDKLIGR
jgi:glycosyltransferase involved in cell wall biosynthesis